MMTYQILGAAMIISGIILLFWLVRLIDRYENKDRYELEEDNE